MILWVVCTGLYGLMTRVGTTHDLASLGILICAMDSKLSKGIYIWLVNWNRGL